MTVFRDFTLLAAGPASERSRSPAMRERMGKRVCQHPVLGRLEWNKDSWEATVELAPGCPIRFAIVAEAEWADVDPAELFEIGANYIAWARKSEAKCRKRIAEDLLDIYNRSWAYEPDEEDDDD